MKRVSFGRAGRFARRDGEVAQSAEVPVAPGAAADPRALVEPAVQGIVSTLHPIIADELDMTKVVSYDREELSEALSTFLERTESASIPVLAPGERARVVEALVHDIQGFGPLEPLLSDPRISDILVNSPDEVYVEREGRLERTRVCFRDASHLLHIAQRIAGRVGRRVDESSPMVDARLPDGSRVNIVVPPSAIDGGSISIRRFVLRATSLLQMAQRQVLSPGMVKTLKIAVLCRLNIIISGGTGAGKTTMLNALSGEIPHDERLITVEDAAELSLQQPHVLRLESRPAGVEGKGEITIRDLVVNTLRMRPDRIIVGECRGAEALEMLQAMNTGHPGSMTSLHANTPRDALVRLENMLVMGAMAEFPISALRRQIVSSIDLIVQVARLRSGHRCVSNISTVAAMEGDTIVLEEIWSRRNTSDDVNEFESSGRLPYWAGRAEPLGLIDELRAALAEGVRGAV